MWIYQDAGLDALPHSLGQLSALQSLDLSGCSSLDALPHSLGQLSALQYLDLDDCDSLPLAAVPDSLRQKPRMRPVI